MSAVTPKIVVAASLAALVEVAAAHVRAAAARPSPRAGGFASRWRAGRRRARSTRGWSTASTGRAPTIFFGDERAVPPDDPQSNYRMARETLLAPAQRAADANVFRWRDRGRPTSTPPRATTKRRCARGRRALARPGAARARARRPHRVAVSGDRRRWPTRIGWRSRSTSPAMGTRRLTLTYPAFLRGAREVFFLGDRARQARRAGRRRPAGQHAARRAHRPAPRSARDHILRPRRRQRDINAPPMIVLAGDIGGTNARLAIYDVPAAGVRGVKPIFEQTYPSARLRVARRHRRRVRSSPPAPTIGAPRQGRARLPRHRRPDREQHLPRHQPPLGRRRPRAGAAARHRARHAGQRLPRRRAGRHRGRPRRAGRAGRRPAGGARADGGAGRRHRASARRSCSGRPRRTATRSSRPKGGHVDLAARTPLEHGLVHFLTRKYGRVSCERVLSGQGLVDVFTFLSEEPACRGLDPPGHRRRPGRARPGTIRRPRSRSGRWPGPTRSARWRWQSSAPSWAPSQATSALMVLATGGVFVAGGIAPRVLPLPAAGRLPGSVRPQGAPAHAGRAAARLRRHARAAGPARRRQDRGGAAERLHRCRA